MISITSVIIYIVLVVVCTILVLIDKSKPKTTITRFEYISKSKGREFVKRGKFTFQVQDDGKTIKIFEE